MKHRMHPGSSRAPSGAAPSAARSAAPFVDIALLLDATSLPDRAVSGWVAQMVRAFPQYRFALVLIGGRRLKEQQEIGIAAPLPPNIVHLETHALDDAAPAVAPLSSQLNADAFAQVARMHDLLRAGGTAPAAALMRELLDELKDDGALSEHAFLHGRAAWDNIVDRYRRFGGEASFTEYFLTVRAMHRPLWRLARVATGMIPARVYHALSTGYAGFLGAMLRQRHGRPLLVSERTDDGRDGQTDALALRETSADYGKAARDAPHEGQFDGLRERFLASMGRVCYDAADDIVALFEGDRRRQVADGAPPGRTRTIPTGVDVRALAPLRLDRPAGVPPVLCLIGPVVPAKDTKTFIRAMLTVQRRCPHARAWIAGSEHEDPEYARECRGLVQSLGLIGKVEFVGRRELAALLPAVGVLVLSSIGEALPLTVLEGFAAGVPCVATDVGACRELIHGAGEEDMALGAAGAVVPVADPAALAQAAVALLTEPERWRAAQRAAVARVERYYTQEAMVASYGQIYARLIARPDGDAAEGRHRLAHETGDGAHVGTAARCPVAGAH